MNTKSNNTNLTAGKKKVIKLAKMLEKALQKSDKPWFPDMALPALHNKLVQKALVSSLNNDSYITGVFSLAYEPNLELNYLFFSVSKDPLKISRKGLLCLIDKSCEVFGIRNDFEVPAAHIPVTLPTARSADSSPFVFTQDLKAGPTFTQGEGSILGVDLRHNNIDQVGLTPLLGENGIEGLKWPPNRGRISIEENIEGKNETTCKICKIYMTSIPAPPGGGVTVQDETVCMMEADDCGDMALFSSGLSFDF